METITFTTSKQFIAWAARIAKDKQQHYDRKPVPPQVWIYGDGHVEETGYGERGASLLKNLAMLPRTATGDLEHKKESQIVSDITARGGVAIMINWGDEDAPRP